MSDDLDLDLGDLDGIDIEAEDLEFVGGMLCPDCQVISTSERACHCRGGKYGGCCRTLTGIGAFDRHHVSDDSPRGKRCLTDDELAAAGLETDPRGWWRIRGKDETEDTE